MSSVPLAALAVRFRMTLPNASRNDWRPKHTRRGLVVEASIVTARAFTVTDPDAPVHPSWIVHVVVALLLRTAAQTAIRRQVLSNPLSVCAIDVESVPGV